MAALSLCLPLGLAARVRAASKRPPTAAAGRVRSRALPSRPSAESSVRRGRDASEGTEVRRVHLAWRACHMHGCRRSVRVEYSCARPPEQARAKAATLSAQTKTPPHRHAKRLG